MVSLLGICVWKNPKNRLTLRENSFSAIWSHVIMLVEGSLLLVGELHYCSSHADDFFGWFRRIASTGRVSRSILYSSKCLD